jgi:hypothetical protein
MAGPFLVWTSLLTGGGIAGGLKQTGNVDDTGP